MKRIRKSPLTEVARLSRLMQASEKAGIKVTKFIDFIEYHNQGLDRTTATWTAAFCLHNLPTLFLDHPEMMQQLRQIQKIKYQSCLTSDAPLPQPTNGYTR